MSDYLRECLYELKAESAKQVLQDERRERDRKIEAKIQADKVILIKELDKGIDWVTPELSPKTTNLNKAAIKIHQQSSTKPTTEIEKRLADLKQFIKLLSSIAKAKDMNVNMMRLPVTRKMILGELVNRYPKNFKNGKKTLSLESFKKAWNKPERKNICGIINNKFHDKDFFKNILG